GKVCFPGGAVEVGERQEEAVGREGWEELGVVVKPVKCVWRWEAEDRPLTLWGWVGEVEDWSTLKAQESEVAEIFWMTEEEIVKHPDAMATNAAFCACLKSYEV
ncbi:MAG TPA: NUDIX domain-containing protein, partial [Tepidisphaeraceae bacterium]|nr:NUDIX domain-containing protein [Tepidisphaeraceae bacterium]